MDQAAWLTQVDEVVRRGPYEDTWESLAQHPIPAWYARGKFGLFIHWGVYSVPAFFNEWYPRHMYYQESPVYRHHVKTYGPVDQFGYKDFIPLFQAERFDADAWLSLFKESGARFIMPVGEHHDGFKMYGSELSRWNSVEMGPHRDVLAELHAACDRQDIIFCTSSHRAEHYWFLNGGRTRKSDVTREEFRDFYGPAAPGKGYLANEKGIEPTREWLEDWLVSTCELVDRSRPQAVYFDWWVREPHFRPYMKKFLAYYYNRAAEWGREVCVFYKCDGVMYGCAVYDVERGQLDAAMPRIWQNDTAIAKNSWGYTAHNRFKTPCELVQNLIDVVSKNGCFMLNVGPKADGTICEEETAALRAVGEWMRANGEAIYDAQPYRIYGEGISKKAGGSFHENNRYAKGEYRFTYRPGKIYVFAMHPEKSGLYRIKSLGTGGNGMSFLVRGVRALGRSNHIEYTHGARALELRVIGALPADMPLCFEVTVD